LAQGDHIEIGAFADYFNLSRTTPHISYVGLGGRVGFNVRPMVQLLEFSKPDSSASAPATRMCRQGLWVV